MSKPVTRKFVIWTKPSDPLDRTLAGCRVKSKPARVRPWTTPVATKTGPARIPQVSSVRVDEKVLVGSVVVVMANSVASDCRNCQDKKICR